MYKVRGTLTNGKAFKFDARAITLDDAVSELNGKLTALKIDAGVVRVSFSTRSAPNAELELSEVKKRERQAKPDKPKGRGGK